MTPADHDRFDQPGTEKEPLSRVARVVTQLRTKSVPLQRSCVRSMDNEVVADGTPRRKVDRIVRASEAAGVRMEQSRTANQRAATHAFSVFRSAGHHRSNGTYPDVVNGGVSARSAPSERDLRPGARRQWLCVTGKGSHAGSTSARYGLVVRHRNHQLIGAHSWSSRLRRQWRAARDRLAQGRLCQQPGPRLPADNATTCSGKNKTRPRRGAQIPNAGNHPRIRAR